MDKKFFSIIEVAEMLGVSKSYCYTMVKEQRLPVLDLGGRKIVPKAAFERWVEENTK